VRASVDENPELLWGLRGGGGNFGIVTSFDLRLHPVGPMVFGGALFHSLDRAAEVLRFYADWTRDLPDELTTMAVFITAPPEPFIPAELQGTLMLGIACCYTGSESEGEAAVAALRACAPPVADVIGPIPYVALQGMFDGSAPRGTQAYWKTEYLADLDGSVIDVLVERAGRLADLFPLSAMHLHHLEGAVRRKPEGGSAFTHRDPRFVLNIIGTCLEPADFGTHIGWVRDTWSAVRPHSTGDPYLNFLGDEGQERVRAAYGEETYARLLTLKQAFDPDNVFHLNQNIAPS
jgi:hypothetical protein